jgi:hypothetical protein
MPSRLSCSRAGREDVAAGQLASGLCSDCGCRMCLLQCMVLLQSRLVLCLSSLPSVLRLQDWTFHLGTLRVGAAQVANKCSHRKRQACHVSTCSAWWWIASA